MMVQPLIWKQASLNDGATTDLKSSDSWWWCNHWFENKRVLTMVQPLIWKLVSLDDGANTDLKSSESWVATTDLKTSPSW